MSTPQPTPETDSRGHSGTRSGAAPQAPGPVASIGSPRPALFRSEALAERQTHWLGTVLLVPRVSDHLCTAGAVLAAAATVALLFFGEFTRKERVDGWLVPQRGLARVFSPQAGVITALYVKEGAQVHKGERLLSLSSELESSTLGATQAQVVRRLGELRDALRNQQQQDEQLLTQQQHTYTERLSELALELEQIDRDLKILQERVQLTEHNVAVNRNLRAQGFISEQQLQQLESDRLEQLSRLGALRRERIALQREQLTVAGELRDLPVKTRMDLATVQRNVATTEEDLAEAEARREIVVTAPESGTVTAILVEEGGHATTSAPLLSIVPAGASLEAHLYSPSRAVGFVRPGQHVMLRYQAFPYQKFGHYDGLVSSVAHSAVSPGELPPQLAGITGAEPVYRITVQLARQTVVAYGREIALQPGLQVEADIALETRRLYEWVLDPLYTVTGK